MNLVNYGSGNKYLFQHKFTRRVEEGKNVVYVAYKKVGYNNMLKK